MERNCYQNFSDYPELFHLTLLRQTLSLAFCKSRQVTLNSCLLYSQGSEGNHHNINAIKDARIEVLLIIA
jgi:hypothetical protein